ncbi:hypothetical protein ABBQ38_15517 [Trebouxia sp. C0009 RCD-2024]
MSSMGFGRNACKWVSIMLQNTSASATFNGWLSTSFAECSGVQQGSPLSPLLYVLAAQPLASHLRRQCQQGVIRPITMPDGQPAPVSHQHADDTSLHVLEPRDAQVALDTSIGLCRLVQSAERWKVASLPGSVTATSLNHTQRLTQHQLHHRTANSQAPGGPLGL